MIEKQGCETAGSDADGGDCEDQKFVAHVTAEESPRENSYRQLG